MIDSLATYEPKGGGLFLKVNSGEPVKLRVLTLDPLVSVDQWGGTKYAFVVWNWTEGKAQIWQTTPGNLKKLTAIHRDEDLEPLNKIDIKVSATGEMLEKRYEITPLPKAQELKPEMVKEAQSIKLEEQIEGGMRLSQYEEDGELDSGYEKAKKTAQAIKDKKDKVVEPEEGEEITEEDLNDEPEDSIDLADIPF